MPVCIDLNADLGEHPHSDLDEKLMPFISSCNIACGGHIGDEASVHKTIQLAKEHGVAIGAHPSYPDRTHFGRMVIDIAESALEQSLEHQISLVQRVCAENQVPLHHIKPHGALYNQSSKDEELSALIVRVIQKVAPAVPWMLLADSASEKVAKKAKHPFIREGFADRRYQSDLTLVPRAVSGAVLKREEIGRQVSNLAIHRQVQANGWIPLEVQSICLHSDTESSVQLAREINELLQEHGVEISSV